MTPCTGCPGHALTGDKCMKKCPRSPYNRPYITTDYEPRYRQKALTRMRNTMSKRSG